MDNFIDNKYNKIFKFSDPEKLRIATEWYENGYSIVTSWEMGSIEYELDLYRKNLKSADDELKEIEYNMYKTFQMFDSLEHFKDGEKIKLLFQMENDRVLAESINDHETAMFLQEETDRVLAKSKSINDYETAKSLKEKEQKERENNNLKINEKKLSMSEMTNLLKNSTLGDYLVNKNNKQKRKNKKRKKKKKRQV